LYFFFFQSASKERFIQIPKKYLQTQSSKSEEEEKVLIDLRAKKVNGRSDQINLKVEISESQHKPGAIYRLNNCIYDSNGDFLYKTPAIKS
jgi:hypothetical protein